MRIISNALEITGKLYILALFLSFVIKPQDFLAMGNSKLLQLIGIAGILFCLSWIFKKE